MGPSCRAILTSALSRSNVLTMSITAVELVLRVARHISNTPPSSLNARYIRWLPDIKLNVVLWYSANRLPKHEKKEREYIIRGGGAAIIYRMVLKYMPISVGCSVYQNIVKMWTNSRKIYITKHRLWCYTRTTDFLRFKYPGQNGQSFLQTPIRGISQELTECPNMSCRDNN